MLMTMIENSVQTGDNRNIVLWIILAAVALVLIVLCGALSMIKKQEDKKRTAKAKKKRPKQDR